MLRYWRETLQVIWHAFGRENPNWPEITVDELFERFDSDPPALLIDVRSVEDFNGGYGHIPNSRLIPMLELESNIENLSSFKDEEIVTMCPGGWAVPGSGGHLDRRRLQGREKPQGGHGHVAREGVPNNKLVVISAS